MSVFEKLLTMIFGDPNQAVGNRLSAIEARLADLPTDSARTEVRRYLAAADVLRAVPSSEPPGAVGTAIPPVLSAFFGEFSAVETSSMRVAFAELSTWPRDAAFVRIGFDLDHADVVVHRHEDTVYVVEDDGRDVPNLENPLRSVWHYLILVVETSQMFDQTRT